MGRVVEELEKLGVRSIIDFGCGKGRNAGVLLQHFSRVYLVEAEKNIPLVETWASERRCDNCKVLDYESFKKVHLKADACLLSFVIHTLPTAKLRREVINTVKSKLKRNGILILITPAHDSKYSDDYVKEAPRFGDGIARLFSDGTFSFYKNYDLEEMLAFLNKLGFEVSVRIPGNHRYVLIATQRPPKKVEVSSS